MTLTIELKQLRFYAYHGVMPQETKVGNDFTVDISYVLTTDAAAHTDCLTDTVSYADVYDIVAREMAIPSALIEHAAGRIAAALQQQFPLLTRLSVKLTKLNPPLPGQMQSASVTVETA